MISRQIDKERRNGQVVNTHGFYLIDSERQYKKFRRAPLKVEQLTSSRDLTDIQHRPSVPQSLRMSFGRMLIRPWIECWGLGNPARRFKDLFDVVHLECRVYASTLNSLLRSLRKVESLED